MHRFRLPLLTGLAHGAADGTAGWLLGSLPGANLTLEQIALLVLLYNLLGFGCQPVVGLLTDRVRWPRASVIVGLLLIAAALLVGISQPVVAVALAGLGSAAFHVGGGALALGEAEGRAGIIGLFAAPGVVGLAIGGLLAAGSVPGVAWGFLTLLIAFCLLIAFVPISTTPPVHSTSTTTNAHDHGQFSTHDLLMMVLLAAIAFRSAIWVSIEFVVQHQGTALLGLALAAAFGKMLGGFLADRIGWRLYALLALSLAAPLLALGSGRPWLLLPGIALLQSTTPLGLALMARLLPRLPATAAGLTFGLAIAIGGLPHLLGVSSALATPFWITGLTLAGALALWWGVDRAREGRRVMHYEL